LFEEWRTGMPDWRAIIDDLAARRVKLSVDDFLDIEEGWE